MDLLRSNYANTTTQFVVNDNTSTVANLLTSDIRYQYYTSVLNDDNTSLSIRINFSETLTVDRIALVGHNWREFTAYYNGVTANTFALDSYADTTVSNYATNSNTSHYFRVSSVDCTSVSFDVKKTITANQNKYIGYLVVSQKLTDFGARVPSAQSYEPTRQAIGVRHILSDGGIRIHSIQDKWSVQFNLDYITQATRDDLKDIFDNHEEMIFAPFGTTTAWDAQIFPCVWDGGFEFYKYSDNAATAGFSGTIKLSETPR